MEIYPQIGPPSITFPCGRQNENLNPMGIGLGIDYITLGPM